MDYILCSSLCVLLSCLVSLLSASRCPGTDWYFRKGTNQCYYIYDPTRSSQDGGDGALQTWTETIEECKIRGGKLAVFDDPGELEWIKAKLVSRTYWYWFGLTYENLTWQWYDGYDYKPFRPISGLDVTTPTGLYANEKRGTLKYNAVPDSSGFGFREDSATTYNRNAYICKADWTAKPWCKTEEQWKYYEGRCYKEFTAPENFFLAGAQCFADGGQLPVLKTSSIDDVMKRWVREDLKVTTTWIGISIMQKNATTDANNVMWTDGTRMNETRVSATSGWPTKDLDSYIRGLANDKDYCGELFSTKSGSSDDYGVYKLDKHEWRLRSNCFDEKPYICETPLNKCPYGWHQLDDDCYEINLGQDSLKSWSAASLNCQQKMGNLVVINSLRVGSFIRDILWKYGVRDWEGTGYEYYWIGAKGTGTNFIWHNGDALAYNAWTSGVPPNAAADMCAVITFDFRRNETGSWLSTLCSQPQGYICQSPSTAVIPPEASVIPEHSCNNPFTKFHEGCYLNVVNPMNYASAAKYCEEQSSRLVTIRTLGENAWLAGQTTNDSWIGLTIGGVTGSTIGKYIYKYSNGDLMGDGAFKHFVDETPAVSDTNKKFCVAMAGANSTYPLGTYGRRPLSGDWFHTDCLEERKFICYHEGTLIPRPVGDDEYDPQCGAGWMRSGDSCYNVNHEPASWNLAKQTCQSKAYNSDLLWITTKEEEAFVRGLITQDTQTSAYNYWINLYKKAQDQWYWSYRNSLDMWYIPLAVTNWAPGEPETADDGPINSGRPRCAYIAKGSGRWHASRCGPFHSFICKKMLASPPAPTTVTATLSPGQQWGCLREWVEMDGRCIRYNINSLSWSSARKVCTDMSATLVTIRNQQDLLSIKGFTIGSWIGLNSLSDPGNPRVFSWTSGHPVNYSPWDVESSAAHVAGTAVNDSNCGSLTLKGFAIYPCSERKSSVCEMPLQSVAFQSPPPFIIPQSTGCLAWGYGHESACYYFGEITTNQFGERSLLNFEDARTFCKQNFPGSDLATLKDGVNERDFLNSHIARVGSDFWIGIKESGDPWNAFTKWIDDTRISSTNWAHGEPSLGPNGMTGCVAMYGTSEDEGVVLAGDWYVDACTTHKHALCKGARTNRPTRPTLPPTVSPTGCPAGWTTRDTATHCFKKYVGSSSGSIRNVPWQAAEDFCRRFSGGHLASINNQVEQDIVYFMVFGVPHWIGLREKGNTWEWSDGTAYTISNFHPTLDHSAADSTACVAMASTGKWIPHLCEHALAWVCEVPKGLFYQDQVIPDYPAAILPNTTCGLSTSSGEWYFDTENLQCIYLSKSYENWEGAQEECESMGANLITVTDENYKFIVLKASQASDSSDANSYWIGLRLTDLANMEYTWVDGHVSLFRQWDVGEPHPSGAQRCVAHKGETSKWMDRNCAETSYYICAKTGRVRPTGWPRPDPAVGNCHPGWVKHGQHCYKVYSNESKSWEDAHAACSSALPAMADGGAPELVSIHSSMENDFLVTQVKGSNVSGFWTGLHRFSIGDTYSWLWSDQSRAVYLNWHISEPLYFSGDRCVEFNTGRERAGKWSGIKCTEKRNYICKVRKDPTATPPALSVSKCKDGYTLLGDDACFKAQKLESGKDDWQSALEVCKASGGGMATAVDVFDNAQFRILLDEAAFASNSSNSGHRAWIGMKQHVHNFAWYNSCPVVFSNFATLLPNPGNQSEMCVGMNLIGKWYPQNCTSSAQYVICEQRSVPCSPVHNSTGNMYCPVDFQSECNSMCYRVEFQSEQMNAPVYRTWKEAQERCIERGGHLASIRNHEEQTCIEKYLTHATTGMWFGLYEALENGRYAWKWEDEDVAYEASSYINWGHGNPVNSTSAYSRRACGVIAPNGTWSNADCSSGYSVKHGVICEAFKVMSEEERLTNTVTVVTPATGLETEAGLGGGSVAGIVIGVLIAIAVITSVAYVVLTGKTSVVVGSIRNAGTRARTTATTHWTAAGFRNSNYQQQNNDRDPVVGRKESFSDSYS